MARSDDSTNRKRGPAEKEAARPAKKAARAKAAPKSKPAPPPPSPVRKAVKPPAAVTRPKAATAGAAKPKKAAAAKPAARPAAKEPAPRARKAAAPPAAAPKARAKARPEAPPRPRRAPRPGGTSPEPPRPAVVLTEEEQIEAAKYLPRELPRAVRGRALRLSRELRAEPHPPAGEGPRMAVRPLGRRSAVARARAPGAGGAGERALAADAARHRSAQRRREPGAAAGGSARPGTCARTAPSGATRRELGLTLPSGEFRSLAESNTVRTPRSGPSAEGAPRRARYDGRHRCRRARVVAGAGAPRKRTGRRSRPLAARSSRRPTRVARRRAVRPVGRGPLAQRSRRRGARWRERRLSPLTAAGRQAALDARLLVPGPPRPPAVRPPSRVPGVPRGGLALRGHHRDLRAARPRDGRAAARRRRLPADHDAVAAACCRC